MWVAPTLGPSQTPGLKLALAKPSAMKTALLSSRARTCLTSG